LLFGALVMLSPIFANVGPYIEVIGVVVVVVDIKPTPEFGGWWLETFCGVVVVLVEPVAVLKISDDEEDGSDILLGVLVETFTLLPALLFLLEGGV
jgi:hypothetical protein